MYDSKDFKGIVDFISNPTAPTTTRTPSNNPTTVDPPSCPSTPTPTVPMTSPSPTVRIFTHGITIKNPGYSNSRKAHDCKSDKIVDNILHISDLLNDTALCRVAGPFKIGPNVDHVIVSPHEGKYIKVPLFYHSRFCTVKSKRRQKKGRRVSDLTGSGLNLLYDKSESSVHNLPSLRYIMTLLSGSK